MAKAEVKRVTSNDVYRLCISFANKQEELNVCMQYDGVIKATTEKKRERDFDPGNHRVTLTMGRRETQIAEDMAFQTTCHQAEAA